MVNHRSKKQNPILWKRMIDRKKEKEKKMKNTLQMTLSFILMTALSFGASLSGIITDTETGLPIENAQVSLHLADSSHSNWDWNEASTDENGNYTFDSLAVGNYNLFASAEGYEGFFATLTLDGDMTFDMALNEHNTSGSGFAVSGYINDAESADGVPYAVIKRENNFGHWFPLAWADSVGYYSFNAEGDLNIKTMAWGYNSEEMSLNIDADTTINFALTSYGHTLSGLVTDVETGEGLPYAAIKKENENGHWFRLAWADSNGYYSVDHLEGDMNLKAVAWGYTSEETSLTLDADMSLDFALSAIVYDGSLYGTVSNSETGEGFVGTTVRVITANNNDGSHDSWGHHVFTTETDENGNYAFDNLATGEGNVRVFEAGFEFFNQTIDIGDSTLFDIGLSPLAGFGSISGNVSYDDADGPGYAFIRLIREEGWGCGSNLGVWTDDNGHYELTVPEGNYYVASIATDRNSDHGQNDHSDSSSFFYMEYYDDAEDIDNAIIVSIVENEETANIDFSIPFQGDTLITARVSGIVSSESDVPLNEVTMSVYDLEGNLVGSAVSNINGSFTINGVDVGSTYNLIAQADAFENASQLFEQDGFVTVANLQLTTQLSVDPIHLPSEISLGNNYPNPFNPSTNISFSLERSQSVQIMVYDILGNQIAELSNDHYAVGTHTVKWNGQNQKGYSVASGVYIYTLTSEAGSVSRKMLLSK